MNAAQQLAEFIDRTWDEKYPRIMLNGGMQTTALGDNAAGIYLPNATAEAVVDILLAVEQVMHH